MDKEFTINLESESIKCLFQRDEKLKNVIETIGTIEYTIYKDSYLFLIDTIIGQMLSNKAADVISSRFKLLCEGNLDPESVCKLDIKKLRGIGLSNQKAEYILFLSKHILENPTFFDSIASLDDQGAIKLITERRGLGNWSAKMYLIFVLDRMDVLPYEDGAFLRVYKWIYDTEDIKSKSIIEKCSGWSPYSSIAARYMYKYLDAGYVGKR